jgi:cytochrome c2
MNRRVFLFAILTAISVLTAACSTAVSNEDATDTPFRVGPTPVDSIDGITGDPERGRSMFTKESCNSCHSTGSRRVVGPGLGGISTRGDDNYIRQSIKDPGAVVVRGFGNIMSNFSKLDDQTVEDLIAYLKTLE